MYHLLAIMSAALFSIQFVFNERFKEETDSSWNSALKFTLYTGIVGLVFVLITNKFKMDVTLFSVLVATAYSIICILLSYSSIKAFLYANLSVYSVFAMIGGMILPFLYGVFLGEKLTLTKIICCVLILISILLSVNSGKNNRKALKYYFAVFFLNGMVGVVSKFHQIYPGINVDSGSFMILTKFICIIFSALLLAFSSKKDFKVNKKAFIYSGMYSILNSTGNLILLISLLHLPASVQYTVVTGGTIVFSVIFSVFMKQKNTFKEYLGAAIAFFATFFMVI